MSWFHSGKQYRAALRLQRLWPQGRSTPRWGSSAGLIGVIAGDSIFRIGDRWPRHTGNALC
jgi:hypothetical protein